MSPTATSEGDALQRRDDGARRLVGDRPRVWPARSAVWRNTHPRGNPAPDRDDLERSLERYESLLGH